MKEKLVDWLNKLLVVDVFLVIIGFIWFAIAVIGKSLEVNLGWEIWLKLWLPLFNPAIAILITGAILNWGINKVSDLVDKKRSQI